MENRKPFHLTRSAVHELARDYGTPLLVVSLSEIERNYMILRRHLPRVHVHYAIKANPDPRILERMIAMGSGFDVASDGEIMLLHRMGVESDRMVYANPIKRREGLAACRFTGVKYMTFDNESEIGKIAAVVPDAKVLLRLRIDNRKAHVDLNKKFGCGADQALDLMHKAKDAGLDVVGIAFHVGSQTTLADPFLMALDITRDLFDQAAAEGLPLRILDIGGGMPIPEHKVKFNLEEILDQISPNRAATSAAPP